MSVPTTPSAIRRPPRGRRGSNFFSKQRGGESKVAKTRQGKKKVHVPAHKRVVRAKKGRRRVRIPEHYRSTPE
jgi:hypothetical protein